jgi:ribosome-interacting GTPase 1
MPANLTPEYHKADKWYKSAGSDAERILALEEMLRVIPKHKGTEHMRADLKKRLSKLRTAGTDDKKSGGKHIDVFHIPKSGAGQVVLIGMPNCGKSSIVGALSKAKVNIADYPFATTKPAPGMMKHEDVPIELVDMPPVTADYAAPGQVGTYRGCDLIAIVIGLGADVLEQMQVCLKYLDSHRLLLNEKNEETDTSGNLLGKRGFVICSKCDIAEPGAVETLERSCERNFDYIKLSAKTGEGMDELALKIFTMLDIVRVYAKKPGKEPDMKDPFTLPMGSDVSDLAALIHRELADKLKSAKAWGSNVHPGQHVHRTYKLADKDIIELHFH